MKIDHLPSDLGQENHTAILVVSCKRFEQVWEPFFILFKRFWPDCPYKVYFATDDGKYPGITTFSTGTDIGWGSICLNALRSIDADRIILFQEDFIIKSKVDNSTVRRFVHHAHAHNIGCLRLGPCPGPTRPWHATESLGSIGLNDPYRVSLQLAIWKKSVLFQVIKDGDNPWDIERYGPKRVRGVKENFVSIWRESEEIPGGPIKYFISAVSRGVWEDKALELLKQEGVPTDKITKVIPPRKTE